MKEIMSRRSIRKYTAEAVADADLQQIVESARLARRAVIRSRPVS